MFSSLYRSLRNRGVEFKDESKVDIFTPNLSDEVASSVPSGMHVRRRDWSEVTKGYTSPNAKLENDLHIVQQHMVKMQGILVKRNRRNCIPEKKQQVRMGEKGEAKELEEEEDFLSQCLIRIIDLKGHYDECGRVRKLLRSGDSADDARPVSDVAEQHRDATACGEGHVAGCGVGARVPRRRTEQGGGERRLGDGGHFCLVCLL